VACRRTIEVVGSKTKPYDSRKGRLQRFCSKACVDATPRIPVPMLTCAQCGETAPRKKLPGGAYNMKARFCSRRCVGLYQKAHAKGFIHHTGYRYRRNERTNKWQGEHQIVMEKMIGRALLPGETVHHKNLIRTDNRPENLELWSSRHGRGAHVEDRIQDAIALLEEHGYTIFPIRRRA
jgi:hypothetical protein